MAQDKGHSRDRTGSGGAGRGPTPNRDRRREPAIIEGEALKTPPEATAPTPHESAGATPPESAAASTAASAPKPGPVSEDLPSPTPPAPGETVVSATSDISSPKDDAAATGKDRDPVLEKPAPRTQPVDMPAAPASADPPPAAREAPRRTSSMPPPRPAPPPPASSSRSGALTSLAALAALLLSGASLYVALTRGASGVSQDDMTALSGRIGTIERQISALGSKIPPAVDLKPLQDRLDAVEATSATARDEAARLLANRPAAQAPVDLAPLEKRLGALESKPAAPTFDAGPLEQRIAQLQSEIATMRESLAAPKTAVRATQDPAVTGNPPGDAAALAVVAEALRQKLARGAPFPTELAALEKLGAPADALAPLRGLAEKGAAGADALLRSFREVASGTASAGGAPSDDTFLDRLAGRAASLVRVRPVGEPTGEDAAALVARIEASLRRGDIREAVALWDRLPEPAKKASSDWAARARQRAEAETALRQIIDGAVERLSRTQ